MSIIRGLLLISNVTLIFFYTKVISFFYHFRHIPRIFMARGCRMISESLSLFGSVVFWGVLGGGGLQHNVRRSEKETENL